MRKGAVGTLAPNRRAARRRRDGIGTSGAAIAGVLVSTGLALACTIEPADGRGDAQAEEPDLETQIADILEQQADAWNRGDLETFMAFYERSPSTTYIGSRGLITGFDEIRGRYAPLFEPGAERDSLRFESLAVRELDPRFGIATARYVLYRNGETTSTGPFTLVLMRVEGAWRIVHDQSAADPESDPSP